MKKLLATAALALALTACNQEDHTIVSDPTADNFNAAAEGNFVLPAAVQASKTYRCADDTIVHVDWLADGKSATVRVGESGSPVAVASAEAGQAMSAADGTALEGSASASPVRITLPGKSAQSCKG